MSSRRKKVQRAKATRAKRSKAKAARRIQPGKTLKKGKVPGDRENFKAWYADVLAGLYRNRRAGIAAVMISLPLAERYLRQKRNVGPDASLTDDCMTDLVTMFPALRDVPTARQFWNVYRHGFLHQATLLTSAHGGTALPVGWLTHDTHHAVEIRPDGSFCIHPVLFSKEIVRRIEGEFHVFAGVAAGAPRLPNVAQLQPVIPYPAIQTPYILGTRGGP